MKQNIYIKDLTQPDTYLIKPTNKETWHPVAESDVEKLKLYSWYEDKFGYLRARYLDPTGKPKSMAMHAYLNKYKPGKYIDHKNGDRGNNHSNNTRYASERQNAYNKKVLKNNILGIKGIKFNQRTQKYEANIWNTYTNGYGRYIGSSTNLHALMLAYNIIYNWYTPEDCKDFIRFSKLPNNKEMILQAEDIIEANNLIKKYIIKEVNGPKHDKYRDRVLLAKYAEQYGIKYN